MYGLPLQSVRFLLMHSVSVNVLMIAVPELSLDPFSEAHL